MSAIIGLCMALAICGGASMIGFGRERSFYPTMVMVIASYYVLFAIQASAMTALFWEVLAMAVFSCLAIIGFRTTTWVVVAALGLHGIFDLFHSLLIANAGVPHWWPGFCLVFDVGMACCIAVQLLRAKKPASAGV